MMQSVRGVDQHLWSLGRSPFDFSTRPPIFSPTLNSGWPSRIRTDSTRLRRPKPF